MPHFITFANEKGGTGKSTTAVHTAIALAASGHRVAALDLDLIGEVDAETYRVRRPSFYAELVWNSRTQRAKTHGASVDWVVLRNRMQHIEARNMRRVGDALAELSRRVGFRIIPGLGERVIYRELFPKGLTLLDLREIEDAAISHIAARQELREMIAGFALPEPGSETAAPRRAAMAL